MIDPFDVPPEVSKQLVYVFKGVPRLLASEVPMIALARLVVIPENANSSNNIGKPVLVGVCRSR
jgi:hypothetical protein